MIRQRGFLSYDSGRDRYWINWRETLSIVAGELLLHEILAARPYITGRLLDVGCGKRPYSLIYESLVDMSIGTEVAFSPHGTQAANIICFAERLPFAGSTFDTILCTEVLEHTAQPFEAMHEFARLLKPGGHLLLSVPFIYPIHEAPYDYWRFTSHALESLCCHSGFKVLYLHSKGGVATSLLVILLNIQLWALNSLSRLGQGKIQLRDVLAIRWLLDRVQRAWLWLIDTKWSRFLTDPLNRMAAGYFLVAEKGLASNENPSDPQ
jgi:SAM-dependent methyltransferase